MEKANRIFTVDVEEYYRAENISSSLAEEKIKTLPGRLSIGLNKLLNLLEKHHSKATFFILGCVAEKNRDLLRKIADSGHEIASHGYSHIPLYGHTPATFEADLAKSLDILSDITGQRPIGYRAVNFSFPDKSEWFFDILRKYKIVYDSSLCLSLFRRCSHQITKAGGDCRISKGILEFPVSFLKIGLLNLPLGGGYFRAYPYWLTKWGIENSAIPPLFYIHPWELDPEQPRFEIPPLKAFRHYFNLKGAEKKLERLLTDMQFTSIKNTLALMRALPGNHYF